MDNEKIYHQNYWYSTILENIGEVEKTKEYWVDKLKKGKNTYTEKIFKCIKKDRNNETDLTYIMINIILNLNG